LECGALERCFGLYGNPWFLVSKKDKGYRLINAAQRLNAVTVRDLNNAQFPHLYGLPTYGIDKKSLNTAIKGSKGVIEKACDVQMDYGGYTETRMLYVAHLARWDMILGKPALTALNALIPAGPKPVTIQPEGMARFALKEWRKAGLDTGQVTSTALSIEDEVPDYLLPLCELIVSAMSLGESREFNPYVEFAQLFLATTPN